jgi:hypothetical protein
MGRCDPVPFDSDDSEVWTGSNFWIRFPVCADPDGMQAFFDVCVPDESGTFSLSETDVYRLLCHVLVQRLPPAAFGEAVAALTGMYEFYRDSPALLSPPPPRSVKARVTGSYTAPVYPIMEE